MERQEQHRTDASQATSTTPPRPSTRVQVIAVLHFAFAVVYLGCMAVAGFTLATTVDEIRQLYHSDFPIVADSVNAAVQGLTCVGLLVAGILLVQRRATGRTLTVIIGAAVLVFSIIYGTYVTILFSTAQAAVSSGQSKAFLTTGALLGTIIRLLYPTISAGVLLPQPEQLGLE